MLPKMSLQLYQVDQRSYLLDFKNLVDDECKEFFLFFNLKFFWSYLWLWWKCWLFSTCFRLHTCSTFNEN